MPRSKATRAPDLILLCCRVPCRLFRTQKSLRVVAWRVEQRSAPYFSAKLAPIIMSEPETYSFDVRGRIFKVRRSLLESFPQTMLARAASEVWNQQQEQASFVDRDPDLFRYCLDYMRNGQRVHLPFTESKAALLDEMEYYGFQDVDPSSISIDLPVADVLQYLSSFDKRTKADIATAELRVRHMKLDKGGAKEELAALELRLRHMKLARYCFAEYKNSSRLEVIIFRVKGESEENFILLLDSNEFSVDLFHRCLEQYGLRYVKKSAVPHIPLGPSTDQSTGIYRVVLEQLPKTTSKTSKDSDTDL